MCGKCQSSRGGLGCVYEDLELVSFGGLGAPAEEVTTVPPSSAVLEFLNYGTGMELNATDFEDPFAFDATTLPKDDLHLRLYVSHCLHQRSSLSLTYKLSFRLPVHADAFPVVSSLSPTVTRSGCVDLSPSNRP